MLSKWTAEARISLIDWCDSLYLLHACDVVVVANVMLLSRVKRNTAFDLNMIVRRLNKFAQDKRTYRVLKINHLH